MDIFTNDLSVHGQFYDVSKFDEALDRVMEIRKIAKQYGRELYCHRNFANVQINPQMRLLQAVQRLAMDKRRSAMQWITRHGPFWDDDMRRHGSDEYFECNEEVVTDSAVGETAYRCLAGIDSCLASLIPSSWDFSPVIVTWHKSDEKKKKVKVVNYWEADALEAALREVPVQVTSWNMLANMVRARCTQLTFSPNCFDPLQGYPLVAKAAQDILRRIEILDQLKTCFDSEGRRTDEGRELYDQYFTGDRARFSDSSDTEKSNFRVKMTFPHPTRRGESLFCPWHGKVNHHPPLRIHFSWPITSTDPLYVVYVGPKITQR